LIAAMAISLICEAFKNYKLAIPVAASTRAMLCYL